MTCAFAHIYIYSYTYITTNQEESHEPGMMPRLEMGLEIDPTVIPQHDL